MSSQAHFDPSNYFIDYEAVLDNKEARKIFQDFLQDCRNEEPLLFLDTYAEYFSGYEQVLKEVFGGWADEEKVSLKNSSNSSKQNKNLFRNEVILRVEKIIQTFIEYHSEKELNIGTSQSWLLNYWKLAKEDLLDTFITLTGGSQSSSRLSFCVASDSQLSLEQLESAIMKKLHPEALFSKVMSSVH